MTSTILERWVSFNQVASDYLQPIQTPSQHQAALELLETLWNKVGENSNSPYAGFLELLLERIQTFEDAQTPIPDAPAHKILEFLIKQNNLTQSKLAAATGIQQSNLSAILHQHRQLTLEQVRKLATYFGVSPICFL
jgi:HTH-type transcriptional regulator / antitoxin HigA